MAGVLLIKRKHLMAKYSKRASKKVEKVMREKKKGTLRSSSGKKVTSRKQAIAIGLSEARREGAKVPKKKGAKKKGAKKRSPAKKRRRKRNRSTRTEEQRNREF
jgi:hypothetical protein